ncbi:uncharacterized protein Z518_00063 [Rhinocladiella mackenziei CBS 650.93]|uniref:Rhinocladiella mackenziei CBS 650.93 unplaced genomic scaffold supercont1.1, whole genome shotgun sequence n=1 Tax=Rhinocladiella mackenziei CBS 650.93 TaxID=1442369 RepID=A0A0D2JI15_9EURO|nr:uncharacterized protein Z518_00063 [Rhinocladiella mackenziei CBS 650.93]KIX08985.1 hypothetical protein Z518_00063 [Rhinocladiella mackenziei CBS 650.93]
MAKQMPVRVDVSRSGALKGEAIVLTHLVRTHRDRKATYVKTLESEVAKLRARDAAHDAEIQACRETIRRLKELIKYHHIPLPSDLASDPRISSPQATIELLGLSDHSQAIRAQLPDTYTLASSSNISSTFPPASESMISSSEFQAGMNISDAPSLHQAPSIYSTTSISDSMPHPQGLGATQVGVDFVLALEHVCLGHHARHSVNTEGSGHEMMLMSPIMSRSPPFAQSTQTDSGLPDGTRWSVPAVELEKLLEFSDRLSLDGEVTPVEAWQRIRQHPNFSNLTRDGLEALKATLIPEVKCYGFGAVVDEEYFESLLQQALGGPGPRAL